MLKLKQLFIIGSFTLFYLIALAFFSGAVGLITAQAWLFLTNVVFQPTTFEAFLFYLPYTLFQPGTSSQIIISCQFIHWLLWFISFLIYLVLGGLFNLGPTEKLISSVKSDKASAYWLTIRFYLALFSGFFFIISVSISVGVLQLIDDVFVKAGDKQLLLLIELILFLLCIYTHRDVNKGPFDYVFFQALMLVAGNALLMLCLLYGCTITILESVCFNLVFSTLAVLVGNGQLPHLKINNFLCVLKEYFLGSGLNSPSETTNRLTMAKDSLYYYTCYYLFLSCSKGFCWLHLYGKLSQVYGFSPNNRYWLSTVLFLFWWVLAFKFLTATAKYTLLDKDFAIDGKKPSLVLPIEILLLIRKIFVPLSLILQNSWNLHSQLKKASPGGQSWLKRLLKVLISPASCVLTDTASANVYVLSVASPLENLAKTSSILGTFLSLPVVLDWYQEYAKGVVVDNNQRDLVLLAPKVNRIAASSSSPEIVRTAENFNYSMSQANLNPALDGKAADLSKAGAYVGRLIRLKGDCENGVGKNPSATLLDYDACLEAIMDK